ncbi:MAG: hypothetical protein IKH75_12480 [Ruminococcus sp.]|nr:hypothetical protein [Ruminococcus sp.]
MMTYRLQEFVSKISSPTVLLIDGKEQFYFENGDKAYQAEYEKYYLVSEIRAHADKVYITLVENKRINDTNWCGEKEVSFF